MTENQRNLCAGVSFYFQIFDIWNLIFQDLPLEMYDDLDEEGLKLITV